MKIPENYFSVAEYCGKANELKKCEELIESVLNCEEKNIAVMGDANSGKTTLLNKICGSEVKKPTPIVSDGLPLMVATSTGKVKQGYEFSHINNEKLSAEKITLYELPTSMLAEKAAEMDLAIYTISATMPFTATDIENLEKFVYYLPTVIVINKLDLIDDENDKKETVEYVEGIARKKFKGQVIKVIDNSADIVDEIISVVNSVDIKDGREFRTERMICNLKESMLNALNAMLEKTNGKMTERNSAHKTANDSVEEKKFNWDSIRVDMLTKEQETKDKIDILINKTRRAFTNEMLSEFTNEISKEKWLKSRLEKKTTGCLAKLKKSAISSFNTQFELHVAWLVNEANEKMGCNIDPNEFKTANVYDSVANNPNIDRSKTGSGVAIAAGAAAVALAAIVSPLTLIPTFAISVPALVVSAYMTTNTVKQCKADDERIKFEISNYIEQSFKVFSDRVHSALKESYQNIITYIVTCSESVGDVAVTFDDILLEQAEINSKINELMN